MTEVITLLLAAFAGVLKDVIEDAIDGKIAPPPITVTSAESDPAIQQQTQRVVNDFDKANP